MQYGSSIERKHQELNKIFVVMLKSSKEDNPKKEENSSYEDNQFFGKNALSGIVL